MTDTQRNVELVIRAKNLSKKTLDDVRKEIEDVSAALDDQVKAADRGEGSLKALDSIYKQLEGSLKSLAQQQALIDQFKAQQTQLEKLQVELGSASRRLKEFQSGLAEGAELTRRQEQTQTRLTKAVDKAQLAVEKQAGSISKSREELTGLGVDVNNLTAAQDKLLASSRNLAQVNTQLAVATETFDARMRSATNAAKQLADQETFGKQAREAQQMVRASEYVNFWITELEKADAAQRKLSDTTALNEAADRALAAARGYTTLGDASKRLIQNSRGVSDVLRQIADPAGSARSTLGGVEEEVRSLAASVSALRGPVEDYKDQVRQITEAQKALIQQGAALDAYSKQIAALRQARTAFAEARAEVIAYAQTLRQAEAPSAELQAEQQRLEARLASASAEMQKQLGRTRELRDGLRQAGVDTNNLAATQQRLVAAAKTNVNTLNQLTEAHKKYGAAVKGSRESTNFFEENGRTTLSFMQRLRGEILALTTAYFGLQGTINLATGSIQAFSTKQGIMNQLALSAGNDPRAIGEAFEYVRGQADRIGISFEDAAKAYAKFAASAKLAGRSTQEIRFIFETFAEVGQVAQLSTDDLNGVFKALEQAISKGKIQAEELRGQLGDRLFGAFQVAAKALQDQFPDLDKAMKNGEVTSEQLLAIAEEYKRVVAEQLPAAMESLRAQQNRLNSALFDFKVLIAESGFADDYERLVTKLTEFFQSDDGKKFAEDISAAFSLVVDALSWVLDHLEEVQTAVEIAFGLKAAALVAGFATQLGEGVRQLAALSAGMKEGTVSVGLLHKAFMGLAAFFVGWEIGSYLSDEFGVVRQAGIALVTGLMKLFTQLEYAAKMVWTGISSGAKNTFNDAVNDITDMKDKVLGILGDLAKAVGQNEIAAKIASGVSDGSRRGLIDVRSQIGSLRKGLEAELKQIDEIGFQMFQDASDAAKAAREELAKQKTKAVATQSPGIQPGATGDTADADKEAERAKKAYEKLVNERIRLAEQLTNTLAAAEAKIAKNEKLSLEERLRAIDIEYQKVFAKIEKLAKLPGGETQAAGMKATLARYIEALKAQETLKFNAEELERREKNLNNQIALRSQLLETIQNQQEAGLLTEIEAKERTAAVDERMVPTIQAAAMAAKEWAMANAQIFGSPEELETYLAKMEAIAAGTVAVKDELLSVQQAAELMADLGTNAFDTFAQQIAQGASAIDALRTSFLQFAADFLRQIALMIIKQILLNALQNSTPAGMLSGFVNGMVAHDGAVVGHGGTGRNRNVPSSWFTGAPRYHTGGVVGLAPSEYPAILQRNEEVLAADDPRNVLNGGAGGGSKPQDIKVINMVDSASVVSEGMSTSEGTKAIFNVLRANRSQLKQLVG